MMCSVQQAHQRGAHLMNGDRTYRPVLVSYIILRVIRNSLISRVRSCLMLLLNTTHRIVVACIGVLEKRGYWNGRVRLSPIKSDVAATAMPSSSIKLPCDVKRVTLVGSHDWRTNNRNKEGHSIEACEKRLGCLFGSLGNHAFNAGIWSVSRENTGL